jgi:DNA-binding response OmpR family regulator
MASMEAVPPVGETTNGQRPSAETEGTVLVVDDNADIRTFVRSHLAAHFHVLDAADGEAGLALIRQHRPDLVISDVMMPKLDGYALCRAVKADDALRHIPVILLTARAEDADRIYGLEGGADDYLTKPFSMRALEVRVTNLILSRQQLRNRYREMPWVSHAEVVIPPGEAAFMTGVLEVMDQHLGDSTFSTDRLADAVNLSRRQVERRVKALTKQTPAKLMRQMRLERASLILDARPGSIAEVAYAVGFKSPSHFSVAFRKAYGRTPSEHVGDTP